jgi:hypothetical protein
MRFLADAGISSKTVDFLKTSATKLSASGHWGLIATVRSSRVAPTDYHRMDPNNLHRVIGQLGRREMQQRS